MVARGEQGSLRIGIHALIPGSFIANLLERYREQHPGIEVQIAEGTARNRVMQLRADRLDVTSVAGLLAFPDCHSRRRWSERLLAALPERHPLADGVGVTWTDLAGETFIVRHGCTGPQVHDNIVKRLAGRCANLSILRFDVERVTLLSMIAQGYGAMRAAIGGITCARWRSVSGRRRRNPRHGIEDGTVEDAYCRPGTAIGGNWRAQRWTELAGEGSRTTALQSLGYRRASQTCQ